MFFTATSMSADNSYLLEPGETLLEERIVDETHTEIFTSKEQQHYLKKLEKADNRWSVTDVEIIYPKWTGLITNDVRMKSSEVLPDNIEAELKNYGLDPSSLPPVVDYSGSQFLPPVGEQHENSCVGWAVGYYLRSYQQAKDFMWEVKQNDLIISDHVFSPTFIYNQINSGIDNGSSLADASQLVLDTGVATMFDFPYISGDFYTRPSEAAILSAHPHRVKEWHRLFSKYDTSNQEIVQRIKEYLNTGDLVVAGSNIGYSFNYPHKGTNGISIITTERNTPLKHAYVIAGYDDTFISSDGTGAFIILSSWGKDWGDQGFCHISYDAFTKNVIEGFVFTDLLNNVQGRMKLSVNNSVTFNILFSGACTFDYKILDDKNELIYEENGLKGTIEANSFIWDGYDMQDNKAADGKYILYLTTYNNGHPGKPITYTFEKISKAESINGITHVADCYIQSVDIPITHKTDGILDLLLDYGGVTHSIVKGKQIKAGESAVYNIDTATFDFNNKDLNKVNIVIDIK